MRTTVKNTTRLLLAVALLSLLATSTRVVAAELPEKNAPARAKCPVCGMFVSKDPAWACEVEFRGTSSEWFDGPKDMFKCLLDMKKYLPAKVAAPASLVLVRDYYTLKVIDGRSAYYVMGSDIEGPMGADLVPFEKQADAEAFMADHGGKKVLKFSEVTSAVLDSLD